MLMLRSYLLQLQLSGLMDHFDKLSWVNPFSTRRLHVAGLGLGLGLVSSDRVSDSSL